MEKQRMVADNKIAAQFNGFAEDIFGDVQNPFTFTKYGFVDPETTEFGSNMSRGGANSVRNYPTLRYFGGGINVTF